MSRMLRPSLMAALAAGGSVTTVAPTDADIGGTTVHIFSDTSELGVEDVPFVLLGGGAIQVVSTDGEEKRNPIDKNIDEMAYVGVGAKYRVVDWGLRVDGRALFLPASVDGDNAPAATHPDIGAHKDGL